MSHFTVLVAGADVEAELAPFHEFECTGVVDEYVKSVDQLEQAKEAYESGTVRRIRTADGRLIDCWCDELYRAATAEEVEAVKSRPLYSRERIGFDYRFSGDISAGNFKVEVRSVPEGWEEVEVPCKEVVTLLEYIDDHYGRPHLGIDDEPDLEGEHKWGWVMVGANDEVVELVGRTNPDAKWDWWEVGGRWAGFWKVKPEYIDQDFPDVDEDGYTDQCLKKHVDIDAMMDEAAREAGETYARFMAAVLPGYLPSDIGDMENIVWPEIVTSFQTWSQVREAHKDNIEEARRIYHEQPLHQVLLDAKVFDYPLMGCIGERLCLNNGFFKAYVERARWNRITPFAALVNGNWYQKGDMGWWGCVANEKDDKDHHQEFKAIWDSIADDTLITLVDCHI